LKGRGEKRPQLFEKAEEATQVKKQHRAGFKKSRREGNRGGRLTKVLDQGVERVWQKGPRHKKRHDG